MLEMASRMVISRMIDNGIISEEERATYIYNLQVILESIVGHAILLVIAAILGHFYEVLVFLFSFDLLRRSTGGFHCKTNIGCITLSVLICTIVVVLQHYIDASNLYYQSGVILSMIFVFLTGAVNHPDMDWTLDELRVAKRRTRIIIVVLLFLFSVLNFLKIESRYFYFFSMGIVQCAISLGLAKLLKKGGNENETDS